MEITKSVVYGWIEDISAASQREYRGDAIYVTEITECMRKHYFTRTHPLRPREKTSLVLMSIGNGLHRMLQEYLVARGWRAEVLVSTEFTRFKLIGHVDLYHPVENIAVELKTASTAPEKPYGSHVMQLNAYLSMLGAEKGYIIYVSRDGRVEVFQHKLDKALWDETVRRAVAYYSALKRRVPPRPERSHLCTYCVFKWDCYSAQASQAWGEAVAEDC